MSRAAAQHTGMVFWRFGRKRVQPSVTPLELDHGTSDPADHAQFVHPRGNIYLRGIVFEARALGSGANITNTVVELDRRYKRLGSAFTLWETISTWTLDFNNTAWEVKQGDGTLAGYYDDYEYRLRYSNPNGLGSGPTTKDVLRNVYLTVTRATK